ncbi:trypsin-like serine peptidase [Azospirillum sp. B2RO_4]|uniref:trypsin-like serine peptidase n=1 Tax=Azospirillum sp. B2RO_4 TaxID=3027796 RepID=UPI003DA8B6B7
MTATPEEFLHTLETARRVAELVTVPRLLFQQVFDDYVAGFRDPDAPRSFMHAVITTLQRAQLAGINVQPADPTEAIALALAALGSDEAIVRAGFVAAANQALNMAGPAPAGTARGTITPQRLTTVFSTVRPEKLTDINATLTDPDALVPAILLARKRLCKVVAKRKGTTQTGTGLLIGPSAVLTNHHVVDQLSPTLQRALGESLHVEFDFSRTSGLRADQPSIVPANDTWCLGHSPMGEVEPDAAGDQWWMDDAVRQAWTASLATALDYAVINLRGTPGYQRGWYKLPEQEDWLGGSCWVLHHPLGDGRSITGGTFQFDGDEGAAHVFHSATTLTGSSGGLVLDDRGRPVALHHLGIGAIPTGADIKTLKVPVDIVNVAVRLSSIAASLKPQIGEIVGKANRYVANGCIDHRRPVFGRSKLLDDLNELVKQPTPGSTIGAKQVLVVQPPGGGPRRKVGKSFTVEILKHSFPAPDNVYVQFSADTVPVGAKAMAARILDALAPSASHNMPEPTTTETAYARQLVAFLNETLAGQFRGKRIWLVLDDLDVHPLTDAGGKEFLDVLYQHIRSVPQMRIVLIGLTASLGHIPKDACLECPIDESDLLSMESLFKAWLLTRGLNRKPLDGEVATLIAKALASFAGQQDPLPSLAEFTAKHLDEALESYFGQETL